MKKLAFHITIFSLLFNIPGVCMTMEEAGKLLDSDNPETVLLAENTFKEKGWDSLHVLDPLIFSGNEAVEKKARQLRRWILFGLNEQIPQATRSQLLQFNSLEPGEQQKIIQKLEKLTVRQPVTLACLHSRVLELNIDKKSKNLIEKSTYDILIDYLDNSIVGMDAFDPRILRTKTRGIVINRLARRIDVARLSKSYTQWFELDPSLRLHLDDSTIRLEFDRLARTGKQREALALIAAIDHPLTLRQAVYETKKWQRQGLQFPLEQITINEAAGYLELIHDSKKPLSNNAIYQQMVKRHPELPRKLRPHLKIHEILRLLDEKKFYAAFDISVALLEHDEVRNTGLKELGEWAAKHPELLSHGLPEVDEKFHTKLYPFINKLAPMDPKTTPAERETSARIYNMLDLRSQREGTWLKIAQNHNLTDLYIYCMALRNRLDKVVTTYEKKQSSNQEHVGYLLGDRPGFAKQINIAEHTSKTLQIILSGIWHRGSNIHESLLAGDKLATLWQTTRPNLLKNIESRGMEPLLALRLWNKGKHGEAIELLAQDPRNTYIHAYHLAKMLNTDQKVDIRKHCSPISIPTEFIGRIIKHIQEDKRTEIRQIKHAITLSAIYRERADRKLDSALTLYDSRNLASALWLKGETELAYEIMETAFWSGSDPEERRMGLFPELALAYGRIDEAVKKAQNTKSKNDHHTLKLAYLLRAAGKIDEAFKLSQDFPKSRLHLQMCLETQNWQAASAAIAHKKRDSNYKNTMRCWYAYLDGDPVKTHSRFNLSDKKSQWLDLLLGNYTESTAAKFNSGKSISIFEEKALIQRAREHSIITHCEQKLLDITESNAVVPYQTMRAYFNYATYLPNKKISTSIAARLGKIPTCDPQMGNTPGWEKWAHKTLAIHALAKLGRTDLVKAQVQHMFTKEKDLSSLPTKHQKILLQGILHPMPWVPDAIVKLTALESPDASLANRLALLTETFSAPDRLNAIQKLVALTRKHEDQLKRTEIAELTSFFSRALHQEGHSTNELMRNEGSPLDALELKLGKHPAIAQVYPTHHRWSGKASMTPKPGNHSNPKTADFKIIDGVNEIKSLLKQNQKDQAQKLVKDITIRIILDEKFVSNETKITVRREGWGSSFGEHPPILAMICCDLLSVPSEIALPWAKTLTRIPTRYADHNRYKWASHLAITAGNHPAALSYYLQYANSLIHDTNYREVAQLVARLHDLRLIAAVEKNDDSKAIYHLRQRMQLDPYDTRIVELAIRHLQSVKRTGTVKKVDNIIISFWENKLLRLPGYPPYQDALAEWKKTRGRD